MAVGRRTNEAEFEGIVVSVEAIQASVDKGMIRVIPGLEMLDSMVVVGIVDIDHGSRDGVTEDEGKGFVEDMFRVSGDELISEDVVESVDNLC